MTDLVVAAQTLPAPAEGRAEQVLDRINTIKADLVDRSLELGRLLREVRDNGYHLGYGFGRFGDWVEKSSGLDMSERSAYYLISVIEFQARHGISDEQLKKVGISKSKELASLPADTDAAVVLDLVKDAETQPLSTVRDVIGVLKDRDYVYKTLKLGRDFAEGMWEDALERARRRYGNTINSFGETKDITPEQCLTVIFADFLASPDLEEEVDEYRILCNQVMERDGWRCRNPRCGSREGLQAHHLIYRSAQGADTIENLVTICARCHEAEHAHKLRIIVVDAVAGANGELEFIYEC